MTSILFQCRNNPASKTIDSHEQISLQVRGVNLTLISGGQYFSHYLIDLSRVSLIVASDERIIDLYENASHLNLILQDPSIRLSDLLFYSPALSGFADCILVADAEYLVMPGLCSNFNMYHCSSSDNSSESQRKLNSLLSSLFVENKIINSWDLIPKFSMLFSSDKRLVIKRFPRFYSDSSYLSFFDQHIPHVSPRLRECTEQVSFLVSAYLEAEISQKLQSLDLTYPRMSSSGFDDRCSDLRDWLTTVHAFASVSYEDLILYLMISHRCFLECLLDLYLCALSPQADDGVCRRNNVILDWYLQSLVLAIAPFLSPLISSVCMQKMAFDDLETSNFELALSSLIRL